MVIRDTLRRHKSMHVVLRIGKALTGLRVVLSCYTVVNKSVFTLERKAPGWTYHALT